MKYVTVNTYDHKKNKGETNNSPSMTQPDMALSLKTLIDRHTRGLQIPVLTGTYSNESEQALDLPDLQRLDKLERLDLIKEVTEHVQEVSQEVEKAAKQKVEKPVEKPTIEKPEDQTNLS